MNLRLKSPIALYQKRSVEKRFAKAMELWSLKGTLSEFVKYGKRSFFYGNVECVAECVTCFAVPGTAEVILNELSKIQRGRLLNLGGGPHTSSLFEALGFSVTSVDIEASARSQDLQFDLNSTRDLPFVGGEFQVVVAQEIVEHLENPWLLFRRANSALAEGGLLIITTPNILSEKSLATLARSRHFHWFTPDCFSYHVNPIPFFELELIASRTGFTLDGWLGNNSFFDASEDAVVRLKKSECLIYLFRRAAVC